MSFITPNGPKANSGEKKQVLLFLKELLPNNLVAAIKFLLYPCCGNSGTGVAVCTNVNTFNLTLTLNAPLPAFPGEYDIQVFAETSAVAVGTYTAPNTITATLTFTGGGITNVTENVTVIVTYPTNSKGDIGVYHGIVADAVVFDGGPCD